LALDEFEALEDVFLERRFNPKDILGMLRYLIQHRPRFTVLIAGSHSLEELRPWASYLINLQAIHLGYLSEEEARQLIERPVKTFSLIYQPEAVQRILNLTHGHPCLIQLLCYQIVAYKNEQDPSVRRLATPSDVEAAVPRALSQGSFFFFDLCHQIDTEGLKILRQLAAQGERGIIRFEDITCQVVEPLLRREILEPAEDGCRFKVELIRRWFESRKTY
jgi:hypothetical protein